MPKTKTQKPKWTSDQMLALLRSKYALPSFAFCPEVPNATSLNKSRSCDAIAMGCWKSVGIKLHGFEIKVARSDWQKELQDRSKSATFEEYCHFWWIVAPEGIVKPEELPASWGLMVPSKGGLRTVSAPDMRTPDPIPHTFLAAIMRRMQQAFSEVERAAIRNEIYREAYEAGKASAGRSNDSRMAEMWQKRHDQLQTAVDEFQKASGIKISSWDGGFQGEQFAKFRGLIEKGNRDSMNRIAELARKMAETAVSLAEQMNQFESPEPEESWEPE